MRTIKRIIIHCSETKALKEIRIEDIKRLDEERGFNGANYHYVIYTDGSIHKDVDEGNVAMHCLGFNDASIGVCYVGGVNNWGENVDTRTEKQKEALITLIRKLKTKYPRAKVYGHSDFSHFKCPCFNAKLEYKNV